MKDFLLCVRTGQDPYGRFILVSPRFSSYNSSGGACIPVWKEESQDVCEKLAEFKNSSGLEQCHLSEATEGHGDRSWEHVSPPWGSLKILEAWASLIKLWYSRIHRMGTQSHCNMKITRTVTLLLCHRLVMPEDISVTPTSAPDFQLNSEFLRSRRDPRAVHDFFFLF